MKFLIVLLLAGICGTATAKTADIFLSGVISNNMGQAAQKLADISKTKDTVTINIDSPGGSVYAGWHFISTMKQVQAKGITIDCYVSGMAASMAFQILSMCDNKYVLEYSMVLWHPVRTGGRAITPRDAVTMARDLIRIEKQLVRELRENISFDNKYFFEHYHAETFHLGLVVARELSEIKAVKTVPDVTNKTFTSKARGFQFLKGAVIYAHPHMLKMFYGL